MSQVSDELAQAKLNANASVAGNAARVEIYAGTDSAGTANAEGTLLAVFTMGSPFAPAVSSGRVQSPTLPAATTWVATGTAGWARLTKADGTTAVMDLTVGTSGAEVNLSSLGAVSGGAVSMTSFTITYPA